MQYFCSCRKEAVNGDCRTSQSLFAFHVFSGWCFRRVVSTLQTSTSPPPAPLPQPKSWTSATKTKTDDVDTKEVGPGERHVAWTGIACSDCWRLVPQRNKLSMGECHPRAWGELSNVGCRLSVSLPRVQYLEMSRRKWEQDGHRIVV